MYLNSEGYKNQIKTDLERIIDDLDNSYYSMRKELETEILNRKNNIEKIDEETNELFSKLSDEICVKLIKHILPFRIKLFNKVTWHGHGVYGTGKIIIYFHFNNNSDNVFQYVFNTKDIKKTLKID